MMRGLPPFLWARLNADTVLLALLAIGSGLFDIYEVAANVVVMVHPEEAPLAQGRAIGYVIGGVLILTSLLSGRINYEILGRFILIGAVLFQSWRRMVEFGLLDSRTDESLTILAILVFVTWLRISGLFAKDGISVFLPPQQMSAEKMLEDDRAPYGGDDDRQARFGNDDPESRRDSP